MIRIVLREKPSIMIGTDLVIAQIGYLLGKTSVDANEDDTEAVPLFAKYTYPYATWILAPNGCDVSRFEKKVITQDTMSSPICIRIISHRISS